MIQLIIIVAYFLLILCISIYMNKSNKSISDYVTANSSMGVLFVVPMILSEVIAGSATIGVAGTGYTTGISAGWSLWGMGIGCALAAIFVAKFYRVMACRGKISVGEAFAEYFDNRVRIVMVIITTTVCLILFSLQPSAAAAILAPLFGIDTQLCTLIIAVFFIVTALLGGIKGVARVNFIHALVMYLGIGITCFFAVRHAGGLANVHAVLEPRYFSLVQPSLFTVLAWILGASINVPAGAMVSGAIFTSKSVRLARRALVIAGLLMVPFGLMGAYVGMAAKASGLEIAANNAIFTITNEISPVLSGVASMAILAAILSSAPALLILISGTFTRDIYMQFFKKEATDQQQRTMSKVFTIAFGIIGILMGTLIGGSLLGKFMGAFQIRAAAGLVIMVAMVCKKVNNHAAFWSMLFGGGIAIVWFFLGNPFGIEPLWPSLIATVVILAGFILFTKEPVYEGYRRLHDDLEKYKDIL